MKKLALPAFIALFALFALTGCAGAEETAAEPKPERTQQTETVEPVISKPKPLGKVDDIDELREAYVDAGFDCDWEPRSESLWAAESGECDSSTVLSVFDSWEDLEEQAGSLLYISKEHDLGTTLVVDLNWIINTDDPEAVKDALGGQILTENDING